MSDKAPAEAVARYLEVFSRAGGLFHFGAHPDDFKPSPDAWFRKNRWRFVLSLDQIAEARIPVVINEMRACCGVYFLFNQDRLEYVGQSRQLQYRISQHVNKTRLDRRDDWFSHVAAIWVPIAFLDTVECYYIKKFKPPRNAPRAFAEFMAVQMGEKRRSSKREWRANPLEMRKGHVYDPEAIALKLDEYNAELEAQRVPDA